MFGLRTARVRIFAHTQCPSSCSSTTMAENGLEPSAGSSAVESLAESESREPVALKTVEQSSEADSRESLSPVVANGCGAGEDGNADAGDESEVVKDKVKKRSSTKKMMEKALYLCDEDDDEPPEKLSFEGTTPEVGGRAKWLERQRDRETKNKRLSKTKDGTFFSYMFLEKIFRESRRCKLCDAKDSGKPQTDDESSLELYVSEKGVVGRQRLICSSCHGVFPVVSCETEAEIPDKPEYQIDGSTVRYYCKKAMHFGVLHDLMELLHFAALESDKSRKQKHFELAEFMLYNARKVCKEWCKPENSELRNKRFIRLREDTLLIRHKPIFTIDHNAEYKEMYGMMAGSFRQHREKVKLLLELLKTTLFDNPTQSSFFLWVAIAMIHAENYQKFKERYDPKLYMLIDSTEYQALKDRYLAMHVALGVKKIPICFVLFELPRFYHYIEFLKERVGKERPTSFLTVDDQRTLEKFDRQAHKYMMKRRVKSGKLVSVESHLDLMMQQDEIDRELMFRNTKEKERAKAEDKKRQRKTRREERQRRAIAVKELQDDNRVTSDGKIVEEISESLGDLERMRMEGRARMPYPPYRQRTLGPLRERTGLEKDMVADMTFRKPYKSHFELLLEEEDRQWGLEGNWSRKDILLCEDDMMFERTVCIRFKKPEKRYSDTIPSFYSLPPPNGRMPTQAEVQLLMDRLLAQEMEPISFDGACSSVSESQRKRWKKDNPTETTGKEEREGNSEKEEKEKSAKASETREKEGGVTGEGEKEGEVTETSEKGEKRAEMKLNGEENEGGSDNTEGESEVEGTIEGGGTETNQEEKEDVKSGSQTTELANELVPTPAEVAQEVKMESDLELKAEPSIQQSQSDQSANSIPVTDNPKQSDNGSESPPPTAIGEESENTITLAEDEPAEEKEGNDITPAEEKEENDITPAEEKEGNDITPAKEKEENDITPAEEKEGNDITPAEEKKENDITPAEEKEENDITPAEEKEGNDIAPAEEKKENDIAPAEEKKENDIAPAEEKEGNDIAPAEEKEGNDIAPAEEKKENDIAPAEEKKENDIAPAEKKEGNDIAPAEEKEGNDIAPAEEKKENDITPAEEKEENDIAPAEEKKENDIAPAEEKEGNDIAPAEEKEGNDISPAEEKKENDIAPAEEKEDGTKGAVEDGQKKEVVLNADMENQEPTEQKPDPAPTAQQEQGKEEEDLKMYEWVEEEEEDQGSESEGEDMLDESGTEDNESEDDHSLWSDDEEDEYDSELDDNKDKEEEEEDEEEVYERRHREMMEDMPPEIQEAMREIEELMKNKSDNTGEERDPKSLESAANSVQIIVNGLDEELDQPITFTAAETVPRESPTPAETSSKLANTEPLADKDAATESKAEAELVADSTANTSTASTNTNTSSADGIAKERVREEVKAEEKVAAVKDEEPAVGEEPLEEEPKKKKEVSRKKSKKMQKKAKQLVQAVQRRKAIEDKYFHHRLLKRTPSEEAFEKLMEKKDCTLAELTPEEKQVLMDHCHGRKRRDPIDEEWDRTMFSRRKPKGPAVVRSRLRQKLHDRHKEDDHMYSRAYRRREITPERPKTPEYSPPNPPLPPKTKRKAKTTEKEMVNGGTPPDPLSAPDVEKMTDVKEKLDKVGMEASMPKTEPMKSKVADSKKDIESKPPENSLTNHSSIEVSTASPSSLVVTVSKPLGEGAESENRMVSPDEFHSLLVDHLKANEEAERENTNTPPPPTPPKIQATITEHEEKPDSSVAVPEIGKTEEVVERTMSVPTGEPGEGEEDGVDENTKQLEDEKEAKKREKKRRRKNEKKKANKQKKEEEQQAAIAEQEKARMEQEKAKIELEKAKAELERVKAEQESELTGKVGPEKAKAAADKGKTAPDKAKDKVKVEPRKKLEVPVRRSLQIHSRKKPKNPDFNIKDYTEQQPLETLGMIPLMLTKAPSYITLDDMDDAENDRDKGNSSPGCFIYKTSVENGGEDHPFRDIYLFARKRREDLDVIVEVSPIKACRNHEDVLCLAGKPGRLSYSCKLEVSQLCTPVGK